MATKQKAYQPGDVYHGSVGDDHREQIELVGTAARHVVTVTEGRGTYGERGIEVSVAEDPSADSFVAQLSRQQAGALFDALAEILNIDFSEI